jgi:hypothetical protein
MKDYVNINHNNISEEQYGFWRNSSTGKGSHKLINDILQSVKNKMSAGGIFCNFQKSIWLCKSWFFLPNFDFMV